MLRDSGKHPGAYFLAIVKREDEVRIALPAQDDVSRSGA
jgi:hypothetical protein